MIALYTTVLVYAVGDLHDFRGPCRRIIEAVQSDRLAATTTVEVIQESRMRFSPLTRRFPSIISTN